jgi:hypothetical protein
MRFYSRQGKEFILFSKTPRLPSFVEWLLMEMFPGIKRMWPEADHSSLSSAEIYVE